MFIRRITAVIISIVIIASGLQFLRSLGMFNLLKNVNAEITLEPAKKLNAAEINNIKPEKYLIIINEKEENSNKIAIQLEQTLNYLKKDYEVIDILSQASIDKLNDYQYLNKFDSILIAFERLDNVKNLNIFLDYVKSGKSLAFIERPVVDKTFKESYTNFGIKQYKEKLSDSKRGIRVVSDILFGAKGFETDSNMIINSSIIVELKDNVKIHLTSYDNNPLLWENDFGSGKFIFFNGTMLASKQNRGIIVAILSKCKPDFIYPIANIKMVHIDDFPAPIPQGINEAIYKEFSRDIPQFYSEIWWPEMLKLSKKYDIKYSTFIIETYNNKTKPPFDKGTSATMRNLMIYGREILANSGELGLHGYNHQSLAPKGFIKQNLGYNYWESIDDMKASIEELIRFVHAVFGHYKLQAYVPTSNILSPEGREAVKLANPDLKIIASVYLPNKEGDVYVQEFNISEDNIIEFPRLSAGYEKSDSTMWSIYNGINAFGVFAHFVHPDDVLDPRRNNNKSWTELSKEFEQILSEVANKYGWLKSYTISLASVQLVKYLECKPYIDYKQEENVINIYIDNFRNDIYFILKTNKEIISSKGCVYKKIFNTAGNSADFFNRNNILNFNVQSDYQEQVYLITANENICSLKYY